jgi:hypothetical protein
MCSTSQLISENIKLSRNSDKSPSTRICQSQNFYWRKTENSQTRNMNSICGIRANDASDRAIALDGVATVSSKLVIVALNVWLFLQIEFQISVEDINLKYSTNNFINLNLNSSQDFCEQIYWHRRRIKSPCNRPLVRNLKHLFSKGLCSQKVYRIRHDLSLLPIL